MGGGLKKGNAVAQLRATNTVKCTVLHRIVTGQVKTSH